MTPPSLPAPAADPATRCVHAGRTPDAAHGSLVPPLHQTTTFAQNAHFARLAAGDPGAAATAPTYTYTRAGNPTVAALEEALGALELAPPAVCQRSGMASLTVLALAVLESGDRVAIHRAVYGGTVRLAREVLDPLGIEPLFFDATDPADLARALAAAPRLVLVETPANPTLELVDVAAVAAAARQAGALLAVDNTFQTPLGLRPLELGADVSVYSTTKFVEGHGATLGGALVTRDRRLLERLRRLTKSLGCGQAPFEAWLTLRGLTTLPLRFERHCESAARVARALEGHRAVASLRHPSLASFPQGELAARQHLHGERGRLDGAIVTLELAGGLPAATRFLGALRLVTVAENLGTPETLATHPASMTHPDVPLAQRAAAGITDGLVRLSVGLEDAAAIAQDLLGALDAAAGAFGALEVAS